jgi:hypothetical protein
MDDVKPWWAEVLWVVTAASGGVAISTLGSNVLHWPRSWFLVPYVSAVNTFLYGYYRWSGMDVGQSLRHRWRMGIVGAILMRSVMVWGVLRQPASPPPEGLELAMALLWLGVIYGAVDGAFLTVMPVLAIQRACATLGVPSHGSGRLLAAVIALAASLLGTTAYHWGFAEFRGPAIVQPLMGNALITLGYLLTANPVTPVAAHVAMHIAAVLHSPETTVQLLPHH